MIHAQQAIQELLEELAAAYEARDAQRALALFADDVVFVATGGDELRLGHEQLTEQIDRDLSQAEQLSATISDLTVVGPVPGGIGWFYAHLTLDVVADGVSFAMPMRVTGVATATASEDRWQFRQTHFSLPFADQADGESFAAAR